MSEEKEIPKYEQKPVDPSFDEGLGMTSTTTWSSQFASLCICRRAAFAALACSSAAVLIGYDMTLIGSIIANTEFVKQFGRFNEADDEWFLPADEQLIWSLVQYVCAMVGAMSSGQISDMAGRRLIFYLLVGCTIIGTIVEMFSTDWKVWTAAKILFGFAMGLMQGIVPAYVAELSPSHVRGFLLSLFQFWIMFGSFLAACVMEGASHVEGSWSWKGPVISQIVLGSICTALFFLLVPESPYYLASKSKLDKARQALLTLRGPELGHNVDDDLATIVATLQNERQGTNGSVSYLDCFKGTNFRRTLLACLPMVMQHFLGYPLCGNYLAYFLTRSGVQNSFLITMISLISAMLAIICAFGLIERVGRRPQYLFGTFAVLPCLLCIGILGFLQNSGPVLKGVASLCIIWSFLWYLSVGAVGWTFVGEISSSSLRPKTTSIAATINSLVNMGWSIAIPYLVNSEHANLGPKAALLFFWPSLLFATLVFFVMPETKGKSFQELDELFERKTSARMF
ncbi:unnamed protein product [Clonostachys byssicola]|uniref:Major facilitator superfamily (MFS) profile domain-containing protein n=1 Tax=Clonostachys byssicola TaxID=160290 RepID=A0A9N9U622_9HYPO|nr:unnamed protein product [Clonostachys byssicola]